MKFTSLRLLILTAAGALAFAALSLPTSHVAGRGQVAAQDQIEYGEVYDCGAGNRKFKVVGCEGDGDFDYCKVQILRDSSPSYEEKMYRRTIKSMVAEGCKIKNRAKQTENDSTPDKTGTNSENPKATASTGTTFKFKPRDRVMASSDGKNYQPCTVIKGENPKTYHLLCDPHKGYDFTVITLREEYLRAWHTATPAPIPDCPVEEPPGTVSKTAPASAALFKRVIYEKQAASYSNYKVGMKFETFQLGQAYKNVLSGGKLMHGGLPQGATVYPVKTRYVRCIQARADDSYSTREVWDACYGCAKDKFGEWTCGSGTACGANGLIKREQVPNVSYFFKER